MGVHNVPTPQARLAQLLADVQPHRVGDALVLGQVVIRPGKVVVQGGRPAALGGGGCAVSQGPEDVVVEVGAGAEGGGRGGGLAAVAALHGGGRQVFLVDVGGHGDVGVGRGLQRHVGAHLAVLLHKWGVR